MELVDDLVDLRHGRRHQGGEADDIGILLDGCLDNGVGLDILAEVDDLEAGVGEQGAGDVLAEVVDVALDGRDDKGALVGLGARGDELLELVEGRAHRLGGQQDLWQEHAAGAEVLANLGHGSRQALLGDLVARLAFLQGLDDEADDDVLLALDDSLLDGVEDRQVGRLHDGGFLRHGEV